MSTKPKLHLFEGFGVELEYMIVDKTSLDVKPIADVLMRDESGKIQDEIGQGKVAICNELVSHVIELKSNGPTSDLFELNRAFHDEIKKINAKLSPYNACLMPSAAHPWMNPSKETVLWEHDSHEIYDAYDRIFNCKGHGWSNLQSTHINLPFYDDEEFARLHTAIRFLMPLIPALTASSPILDSKWTGYMDKRLYYYEKNQSKIPCITGKVIPEKLFTRHAYQKHVYDRIESAIRPFDPDKVLKPMWLNSRGAMARFDRGAIEIRIIDIQECPTADMAIVVFLTSLIKELVKGKLVPFKIQESFETEDLHKLFQSCVKSGSQAKIDNQDYLEAWGFASVISGGEFWKLVINKVNPVDIKDWKNILLGITEFGTLAERIVKRWSNGEGASLASIYQELIVCLEEDKLFYNE